MKKFLLISSLLLFINPVSAKINVEYSEGIYHATINGEKIKKQIEFISSPALTTNKNIHMRTKSQFTINTGFFDPKNQKTISYIVNDYQTIEDPLFNENIMMNPVLRKNLKPILNRTEFRILDCDGKLKYEIASHNSKIDFLCSIKTSAQGGPRLLPVLHKTPRTLIGIKTSDKGEQEVHIFIVTNEHPMDIYESRDLCIKYGLDSAMAFDGGSSTSFNYKNINVISTQDSGDTGRSLKSFMIIKK